MLPMTFTPLIPANAGTQMTRRLGQDARSHGECGRTPSHTIWVPAFAGISGSFR
jgi:hypothetical protein